MEASIRKSLLKYYIILLILIIIFPIIDIYIWNEYVYRNGLGLNPTNQTYEKEYDVGYGYLDVNLSAVHGFVGFQEWLLQTYNVYISSCKIRAHSSGDVEVIGITLISVNLFKNEIYQKGYYQPYEGTQYFFRRSLPLKFHDNLTVRGNVYVNFRAEGVIHSEVFQIDITYELLEPSFFESLGFYLIILGQIIIILCLIFILLIIRRNRPSKGLPYPLIMKKNTDYFF